MKIPIIVDLIAHTAFGVSTDMPDVHLSMRAPHGQWTIGSGDKFYQRFGRPGHIYSMRPDLTRSGTAVLAGRYSPLLAPVVLAGANMAVIHNAPEEKQRGLWQMFASGLTGTFGGDYSGLVK